MMVQHLLFACVSLGFLQRHGVALAAMMPGFISMDAKTRLIEEDSDVIGMTQAKVTIHARFQEAPAAAKSEPQEEQMLQPCTMEELEEAEIEGPSERLHVGMYVQALPGAELTDADGVEYCKVGDWGRISGFMSGVKKRILVTWERTGQTSSVARFGWHHILKVIGVRPAFHEGDWLQVLPIRNLQDEQGPIYGPQDFGVVLEVHTHAPGKPNETAGFPVLSILWTRTERISAVSTRKWPKYFRYAKLSSSSYAKETLRDVGLEVGALAQAKRERSCREEDESCGTDFFNVSDLGRISGFMHSKAVLVTWQRTGKTSAVPKKYWNRFIRIIDKAPTLKVGDWLQVLPNRTRYDHGRVVFQSGNLGKVVEASRPWNDEDAYGTIYWMQSHRNTTVKKLQWPKTFRLATIVRPMRG